MLYFLYGEDVSASRQKLKTLLNSLFVKKPNAGFFKLEVADFSENKLNELLESQGLFEKKYIVQLDGLFEDKEIASILLARLEDIQNSENIFIFIENKINKPFLKKIEKVATKIQEFALEQGARRFGAPQNGFQIFDLADAFGRRNKKELWILYQKALRQNSVAEEIGGILFWQLKCLILAQNCQNAMEAQLKPFVFNKAKNFAQNYTTTELRQMSSALVSNYHNARRSSPNLELALEKFILEI